MPIELQPIYHENLIVKMKKIICIIGTRPEAIKMAPVIIALKEEKWLSVKVLVTGQHREILDQVLCSFGIIPDIDLNVMTVNQTLPSLTSKLIVGVSEILEQEAPDLVLVQGDTTTVFAASLAAFYKNILIGHIEAGLRTNDMSNPFPEEANRVLTSRLAKWHFAPTISAKRNLVLEGIAENSIQVTGNTVIDSLKIISAQDNKVQIPILSDRKLILLTCHRRENFGKPFENICNSIRRLAHEFSGEIQILYPVHPNPNVFKMAHKILGGIDNITLCGPLEYIDFVSILKKAHFVITDSGGVQEEAPFLGKPVLVLRKETERPEAIDIGVAKLIGTEEEKIYLEVKKLLTNDDVYMKMSKGGSPYGDGHASSRIVSTLRNYFNESE